MWRGASLSRRLLLAAGVFIAAALVVAGVAIFYALHRFVQGQVDQRLDTHVVFLSSTLRVEHDGTLALSGSADGPPFDRPRRGWYWQVTGPKNTLRSRSLDGSELNQQSFDQPRMRPPRKKDDSKNRERPSPADGLGPDGQALHFRVLPVTIAGTPVTIVASSPRAAVIDPLREAMTTLAISLAALGAALVLAMLLQVRLGLRPLERLRRAVADVREGRADRVPAEQPREVQPLAAELNGLLQENAANLERARRHVANLAHGLKTPLATLAVALPKGAGRADELHDLVDLMERRIRHHLGRARAAALSGPTRAHTIIAPRLADLGAVLAKVHADKAIALSVDVASNFAVACEAQDFDEMAGNLMENAFKWAHSTVDVSARADNDRIVTFVIEDDGPGLAPEQMTQMLKPGERLDESAPGFGFGLPITRELAELYGGTLTLGRAASGGLRATLSLPSASASS